MKKLVSLLVAGVMLSMGSTAMATTHHKHHRHHTKHVVKHSHKHHVFKHHRHAKPVMKQAH